MAAYLVRTAFQCARMSLQFCGPPLQEELLSLLMQAYTATTVPTMFLIHMYIQIRCIKSHT